jgi:hypothetical protein
VNLPPGSAPVVALSGVDRTLLRLLPLDERLTPELIGAAPVLLALPDLSGAVLATGSGYALIAGTTRFLGGALPHGVDPDLREPGDLTDEELLAGVRAAWEVVRR